MNTIDAIFLGFVVLIAVLGFVRGVVSQAMSIVGLIAAYVFSEQLSVYGVEKIALAMGSSQEYAKPFAVLWAAVMIFIACRLFGYLVEKFLVDQNDSLKMMNRIGGGFLGAIKGCLILIIAFYILRLIPQDKLEAHAPKITQSQAYQFLSKNHFVDPKYIQTLVEPVTKPAKEMIQSKPEVKEAKSDPKNKKTLEKTEGKMSDEALSKELMKHTPVKSNLKKK